MSRPHGPNTFEYKFHILTPHLSKHKAVFIGSDWVFLEYEYKTWYSKYLMTERLGLMVEEAQTFTENTIFMTERLGLMVEEAQTFRENHI